MHSQMDNIAAPPYLVKMEAEGDTRNNVLSDISKEIWNYLLPGALNKEPNF